MKTYSAQSGYVYQYFYEGQRSQSGGSSPSTEFVFSVSHDRKNWRQTSVIVADAALEPWEAGHQRPLSATERYAIAKLALFGAFDEREMPDQMREPVRVRPADVEAIVDTLGL